jgi:predicted homoserine dehydrogenase-like protein
MYLSTVASTPGIHLLGIADLDVNRAEASLKRAGYPMEKVVKQGSRVSWKTAGEKRQTIVTTDAAELIGAEGIDVVRYSILHLF